MRPQDIKVKLLLLGDGRVGKTSLAVRYTHDKFTANYKPSLGVDWLIKRETVNDKNVKVLVFDTAGQEFLVGFRSRYYTGAHGAILVYDVTRRETFENLDIWLKEVRDEVGEVYVKIVGNKSDLEEIRQVDYEEAEKYANLQGADYMETSALSGENVNDLFMSFIEYILKL